MTADPSQFVNADIGRGRFRPRPTRFLGVRELNGWQLKTYIITLDGESIPEAVHAGVDDCLREELPPPAAGSEAEAAGFLIVHRGADAVWVLADLWTGDLVRQHTFSAGLDRPTEFKRVPPGGPTACVWELSLLAHERDAFVRHVLDPVAGPRLDDYLADALLSPAEANRALVEKFNTAWAEGDIDGLMELMADDPCYRASTGPGPGSVYRGRDQLRSGFESVIGSESASGQDPLPAGEVIAFANRALSFWSYPTTNLEGEVVMVDGVDIWSFRHGKIATKDAYRKSFLDPHA